MSTGIASIAHVIQLAVAPVFLLSGIAALLNVLYNRLSRIVDRARQLQNEFPSAALTPARESAPTNISGALRFAIGSLAALPLSALTATGSSAIPSGSPGSGQTANTSLR
jgi:hypothetical protein